VVSLSCQPALRKWHAHSILLGRHHRAAMKGKRSVKQRTVRLRNTGHRIERAASIVFLSDAVGEDLSSERLG
jgi:hypothetical protein